MARVTAAQGAAKWASRLSGAAQEITQGVQAVTEAPGMAAARSKALWLSQVTASADKWARRVSSVSLQSWQDAMINKGVPRIGQGAQAAIPKVESFLNDFLPYVDQGVQALKSLPKGGVEAGINRAAAMIRHNAAYVRKG
jgi:hypothetical protein